MPRATHDQEELLNAALADLLTTHGVSAKAERRERGRRMDVVADVDGLRVVLEAETGFERRAQAIRDADARLRQGLTTVVLAVCYPVGATANTLAEAQLTWTVRQRSGEPAAEWAVGSIAQLANAVRQVPHSLSGADRAAQMLSDGLDEAVQLLPVSTRRDLAQAIDLPATAPRSTEDQGGYFVPAKRGLLVVATAMLFHHRLQPHLPSPRPASHDGVWPPSSARSCAEDAAVIDAHREAWRAILAVDYRPVFETGRVALGALPADATSAEAIRKLARVVEQAGEQMSGLRHDLLGRIFHRVLDTARYDGSFYTSTAAAVLLATLAIREQDAEWADPNAVGQLRVCDPACGTGTLLMAASERIRDLRHAVGPTSEDDESTLSLLLVEDVLWGYDANLTATHMAATTIGMLSPSTQFGRMNIHRTLLGVFEGQPYLGSLDFLSGQARLAAWPSATQQVETGQQGDPPPPQDLVIMNPPFTRDSLRHDQFTASEEAAIKRREKEVLEGQPHRAAARLHSSGGAFTVLGERLLNKDNGVLAVVLPTVVATAPGNQAIRRYLAERFHIETLVSSHDPQRIFFSENTAIGEMLVICRRWNSEDPKPPTRVVNLARNPETPIAALNTAATIERADESGTSAPNDLTIQHVPSERIDRGDWSAVNFLSPYLSEAYHSLATEGALFPRRFLREVAKVGPAGQRIRDSYTQHEMPTLSGRRALWHHKTDLTQSMRAETDCYIEPKAAKRHLADSYWEQRGRLLLPHRMRLNTARLAAVMLDEPALGSLWTPCRPHDEDLATAQALCLYFNSSVGLLALLGGRDNRVPSYPNFSIDSVRSLAVPDFATLGDDVRDHMASAFRWRQREELRPFPFLHDDPVRKQIDDAVTEALSLNAEWVASIRRGLSEEPSLTNRRHRT